MRRLERGQLVGGPAWIRQRGRADVGFMSVGEGGGLGFLYVRCTTVREREAVGFSLPFGGFSIYEG